MCVCAWVLNTVLKNIYTSLVSLLWPYGLATVVVVVVVISEVEAR